MDPSPSQYRDDSQAPDADRWPPWTYWLTFVVVGALLFLIVNSGGDWGSHGGSNAALGVLLLSFLVSAAAAVVGAVAGMFQKVRLIGVALLSAGLGGLFVAIAFMFPWMARAS